MATRATVAKVMKALMANWPDQQRGGASLELYYQVLRDLPDVAVEAAARQRLASDNPFFPRAGELRQLAVDIISGADQVMPAQEAWGRLMRRIRHYGSDPQFWISPTGERLSPLPELVKCAVNAIGGLAYIGMSDNLPADRARFIEAYNVFVDRARERIGMLPEVMEARLALADERAKLLGDGCVTGHVGEDGVNG